MIHAITLFRNHPDLNKPVQQSLIPYRRCHLWHILNTTAGVMIIIPMNTLNIFLPNSESVWHEEVWVFNLIGGACNHTNFNNYVGWKMSRMQKWKRMGQRKSCEVSSRQMKLCNCFGGSASLSMHGSPALLSRRP